MEAGSSVRSGCRVVRQEIIAGDEDEDEGWIGEGKGGDKELVSFSGVFDPNIFFFSFSFFFERTGWIMYHRFTGGWKLGCRLAVLLVCSQAGIQPS